MKIHIGLLASILLCWVEAKLPIFNPLDAVREPPLPVIARDANIKAINTEWIRVPLDHFSSNNDKFFDMRYMTNDQFVTTNNAPIFIMLGGEWSISAGWLLGGHMFEIARDIGGFLIYTEHRYYGKSWPASSTASEDLKHLVVDQALADVIDLIKDLKKQSKFAYSKVIVFGGSYAGNMATWIRLKYPEYIDGALASSGPVLAKADFYEYLETVGDALQEYGGSECVNAIRDGIHQTKLHTDAGFIAPVKEAYGLCTRLDHTNDLDVQTFYSYITGTFSGYVQYGTPTSLRNSCNYLLSFGGTPMQRLGRFMNAVLGGQCYDTFYDELVRYYKDTSLNDENIYTTRLWLYQTCTEYGYYQTTNSSKQPFGDTLPVSYYANNLCADLYGREFTADRLSEGIKHTNNLYGGLTPNVTKTFSVHGTIDPWHRLGIMDDLNELSPSFLIKDTAHCVDLQAPSFGDVPGLTEARRLIRKSVMEWILS